MKPRLIGLCGHAGAGKDTVADYIDNSPGKWTQLAFADPIKEFCEELFDFTDEQLYGDEKEKPDLRYEQAPGNVHLLPRYAFQRLGDWGRECHPDIWVKYAMRLVAEAHEEGYSVIISDVRFKNEAQGILAAGGEVWKIVRPGKDGAVGIAGHKSETELESITADVTIVNNGTLEHLAELVAHHLRFR